ncbi:MAG: hypothetical protein HFI28_05055 [Lachnospiraceae bacterium]|nr:hypothetical protein [Lachnospiraceae bacterium]
MTPDVNTLEYDLPVAIAGYTISNADNSYTVVLNARLTFERRMQAYQHEMEHILTGDYDRKIDADMLELHSHALM